MNRGGIAICFSLMLAMSPATLVAGGFVDARDFGCLADYETIACAITADGKVTRSAGGAPVPFKPSDTGKMLIIGAAASWTNYSLDPVPLNARIMAVDAAGVATVESVDGTARGILQANTNAHAEFFTDNTDAIARALAYQASNGLAHVQLPAGAIGLCPFVSQSWQSRPYFDNGLHSKPVFVMKNGALLKGAGKANTRVKIGYFGEFEPFKNPYVPFRYSPIVFLFEPVDGQTTTCGIESFSLEFPFSPAVQSGYSLIADGWNTSPARHAIHGTVRDIAVVDTRRNTSILYSINGGLYDANNNVVEESRYVFDNCELDTAGMSLKNQNPLSPAQSGGKSVYITNVVFHGGGNIITRHVLDSGAFTQEGGGYFLQVNQAGFSWWDFNAHSDYPAACFEPWCRVRKAWKGTIQSASPGGNGMVTFAMQSGNTAPTSKADATLLINFGSTNRQVYLEGKAAITGGSPAFSADMTQAYLSAAEIAALTGSPVRVYYEEQNVKAVYDIVNPRRIRLDPATAAGATLLGQTNLDVTVNYSGATDGLRGAFGHTFYVGANVNFYIRGMTITDCAKRSFRVSSGGSNARSGVHELTDYAALPARGMPALCNNATVFQALEEFSGPLTMRRSSASSVYGVVLDMDSNSTFLAQGGIYGPSTIKHSTVSGSLCGGGTTVVENSSVSLTLRRVDGGGNLANGSVIDESVPHVVMRESTGELAFQNGVVEAENCSLQISWYGTLEQYDQWKGAVRGTYTDCEFIQYVTGQYDMTAAQRADFASRQRTLRSGVRPDAFASVRTFTGIFSVGNKPYTNVLADLGVPFQMGIVNACGVRPHHRYRLSAEPKTALFIDSRFDQFRIETASLDDIFVNCYHHNEWDDSLMAAQMEYNDKTEITLIPETDGFTLRPTGRIKPATRRPRVKGEAIVLRWNPAAFCWFEKPVTNRSAVPPAWTGMNGEFVFKSIPNATNGWTCVYDLGPEVTQDIPPNTVVDLAGNSRVYLGYESMTWEDPGDRFQVSTNNGITWFNPFGDAISKAYAQSGIVACDWVSGKVKAAQPIRVKYRPVTAIRWVPVLNTNGMAASSGNIDAISKYAWAENAGWENWNAWGENIGWIRFNASHGRVTIGADGRFDGYAWSESVGWIHFRGGSVSYNVKTTCTMPCGMAIIVI